MKITLKSADSLLDFTVEPGRGKYLKILPFDFHALTGLAESTILQIHVKSANVRYSYAPVKVTDILFNLVFDDEIKVFSLVVGGWVPTSFSQGNTLFLDRNIFAYLEAKKPEPFYWHSKQLVTSGAALDPLLFALEGNDRKTPSYPEFVIELRKGAQILTREFPNTTIVQYSDEETALVHRLLGETAAAFKALWLNFMLEARTHLTRECKAEQRGRKCNILFELADKHKVDTTSLCFVAVLALIYAKGSKFANGVLKFHKADFDEGTAYNAISDLIALELFLAIHKLTGRSSFATADVSLALFWSALQVEQMRKIGNGGEVLGFRFGPDLLPTLNDSEREALRIRCERQKNSLTQNGDNL